MSDPFDAIMAEINREMAEPQPFKRDRRVMCDECGENSADLPSIRCVGCNAYREHTGAF